MAKRQLYNRYAASTLTQADVNEIRRRYSEGETQGALCREFGVSGTHIGRIVRGEAWKEPGMQTRHDQVVEQMRTQNGWAERRAMEQADAAQGISPEERFRMEMERSAQEMWKVQQEVDRKAAEREEREERERERPRQTLAEIKELLRRYGSANREVIEEVREARAALGLPPDEPGEVMKQTLYPERTAGMSNIPLSPLDGGDGGPEEEDGDGMRRLRMELARREHGA